jgi:hypothetical protein
MLRRSLSLFLLLASGALQAADPSSRQLAAELLVLTGTAAVFDSPQVHAALADPVPFLGPASNPRRERLLEEAGFRRWQPLRVWLLQSRREGEVRHWDNVASLYEANARSRGYHLLNTKPLPSAEEAVSLLQPGKAHPGLPAVLAAYGADVLVLVDGQAWGLWAPHATRQGALPAPAAMFPDVLAETMASLQQWPEAGERVVVQVTDIDSFPDLAQVQSVLQSLPGVRQVQVVRVDRRQAWFALASPARNALALALDEEARLPAAVKAVNPTVPTRAFEARLLASPLLVRQWLPDEPARQSPAGGAPVQSPPL